MSLQLASNLLFDTDQVNLFDVNEINHGALWISARVYQSIQEGSEVYEVWFFEWYPESNEEKPHFVQAFSVLEEAKNFALQYLKDKKSN